MAQITEQIQAQTLVDIVPPGPREIEAQNFAFLNQTILGHDGLVRRIASFIPSKEYEEREFRRRRLLLRFEVSKATRFRVRCCYLKKRSTAEKGD